MLACATARSLGDSYCSPASGGTLAKQSSPAVAAALLRTGTSEELSARERALAAWAARSSAIPTASARRTSPPPPGLRDDDRRSKRNNPADFCAVQDTAPETGLAGGPAGAPNP